MSNGIKKLLKDKNMKRAMIFLLVTLEYLFGQIKMRYVMKNLWAKGIAHFILKILKKIFLFLKMKVTR